VFLQLLRARRELFTANNGRAVSAQHRRWLRVREGRIAATCPCIRMPPRTRRNRGREGGRTPTLRRRRFESNRSRLILMVKSRPTVPVDQGNPLITIPSWRDAVPITVVDNNQKCLTKDVNQFGHGYGNVFKARRLWWSWKGWISLLVGRIPIQSNECR